MEARSAGNVVRNMNWIVNAEIAPELNGFQNVVTKVHWACVARGENGTARITGVQNVPAPTNAETYIDIAAMQAMDKDTRRALVIQWAEIISPGFLATTEAAAQAAADALPAQTGNLIEL